LPKQLSKISRAAERSYVYIGRGEVYIGAQRKAEGEAGTT